MNNNFFQENTFIFVRLDDHVFQVQILDNNWQALDKGFIIY